MSRYDSVNSLDIPAMTVKELIKKLQEFDQNLPVYFEWEGIAVEVTARENDFQVKNHPDCGGNYLALYADQY